MADFMVLWFKDGEWRIHSACTTRQQAEQKYFHLLKSLTGENGFCPTDVVIIKTKVLKHNMEEGVF